MFSFYQKSSNYVNDLTLDVDLESVDRGRSLRRFVRYNSVQVLTEKQYSSGLSSISAATANSLSFSMPLSVVYVNSDLCITQWGLQQDVIMN